MTRESRIAEAVASVRASLPAESVDRFDAMNKSLAEAKTDGIVNAMAGFGTGADRSAYTHWRAGMRQAIDDTVLTDMFRHDPVTRKLCSGRPTEATRQSWELRIDGAANEKLQTEHDRLRVRQLVCDAAIWANVYGGSALVLGVRDGIKIHEPMGSPTQIDWIKVIDRRFITPGEPNGDPQSEFFGQPETYSITIGPEPIVVHRTRVILFGGALTSEDVKAHNKRWDDSIIQVAYDAILQFGTSFRVTSIMMTEASQAVLKMEDFFSIVASNDEQTMANRMTLMNLCRSAARMIVVDSKTESLERHEYSFTGISLILDRMMQFVAGAVDYPVTLLFGRSPAGMNATGDSDFRAFYDTVKTYQRDEIDPRLKQVVQLIMKAMGIRGELTIKYNSLWQQTPVEAAQEYSTLAQADCALVDRGILQPEEVALSRFTDDGLGRMIKIDREARQAVLDEPIAPSKFNMTMITPTDWAKVVTMNKALAEIGEPEIGPAGDVSIAVYFEQQAALNAPPTVDVPRNDGSVVRVLFKFVP